MGLFDVIRGQLIDVIEWTDTTRDTIVHKYPRENNEIKMGAQLTVREGQVAIFVNEGQLADVFTPGRYELTTQNMPILTTLKAWKYGFNSPFKADVYFVNTRQFMDCKWGTQNPVMMRDAEFGMVRIRAFGTYAFQVKDAQALLREVLGGSGSDMKVSDIDGQIKRLSVSALSDAVAQSKIPALDLAANYDELGEYTRNALNPKLVSMGLQLVSFVIENISLPEEVEKAMDRRTSMGVVGDLGQYTQFQAAEALRESASNGSGMAGAGVNMGAGIAMGQVMAQAMTGATQQPAPAAAPQAQPAAGFCASCGQPLTPGAKFCPNCGAKQAADVCPGCGQPLTPGAKFCANCGTKIG